MEYICTFLFLAGENFKQMSDKIELISVFLDVLQYDDIVVESDDFMLLSYNRVMRNFGDRADVHG